MPVVAAVLLAVALMFLLALVLLEEWSTWSQVMADRRRAAM
jgi:hypothetical protein